MPRERTQRNQMSLPFVIADLRQRPEFLDTVADRIWRAWWKSSGHALSFISRRLRDENLNADPIPSALIAHDGKSFLGTASVIVSDLPERPHLTPWVAAVWVEPHARKNGVGGALVDRAAQDCFALGVNRAYLCAQLTRSAFYERLGWTPIERDVGPHRLSVFIRDAVPEAGRLSRLPP